MNETWSLLVQSPHFTDKKKLMLTEVKYLSQGHRLVSGGFETQTRGYLILQLFVQCSLEKALQEVPYM